MRNLDSDNDYYLEYGLEKDPFPPGVIDKNIFLTPEINRRLKLAKQHIKASEKLLLISSTSGAGKSLLAQKLIVLKEPDWRVSFIIASQDSEPESLAHSIIRQLLPDQDVNASQAISMLHKFLEQSYQEAILPLIVIDDAHKLSFSVLQFLFQLADLRYNDAFFRFVFFADESINETIAKPGLNELTEGTIQIVSMPGFSQEQISSYLKYRINSCGNSVELPFSDSELEYLYEASGGLPGGINVLARKLMQEQLEKKKPDKKQGGKLLLLAGILLIITAYQYYENRLLKENHASLLKESQESLEAPVNAEKKLTLAAEEQFVIKQQSNENARSSTTHESLSLKLSEILIIQSRENNESIDTP